MKPADLSLNNKCRGIGKRMRRHEIITHAGLSMTLKKWAQHLGVEYKLLHGRLSRGLPYEKVFTNEKFGAMVDITGQRYGRMVVERVVFDDPESRNAKCECICDCGTRFVSTRVNILAGHKHSCGCLRREAARRMGKAMVKHGFDGTPTYRAWMAMRNRCNNKKTSGYENYGGRGIKVCDRWMNSFENFLADMGVRPDGTTLDRYPNVNGNYEPKNCRWATRIEQQNNKRNNLLIAFGGKTMTVAEWSRETGISHSAIRRRLLAGWDIQRLLTEPPRPKFWGNK